jgi:hypothetical protein
LRLGFKGSIIGLRRAPGLWELETADGAVLVVSWRRKSSGVQVLQASRLQTPLERCFPALEESGAAAWLAARRAAEVDAFRGVARRRMQRRLEKLRHQIANNDPEECREMAARAAAYRGQIQRDGGVFLVPHFASDEAPSRVTVSSVGDSNALIDYLFHQARRAERRAVALAAQLRAADEELKAVDQLLPTAPSPQPEGLDPKAETAGIKRFDLADGHRVFVGRNAAANQRLTFSIGRGRDLWFHVRDAPGSHVLIPLDRGEEPSSDLIFAGASLALHYSSLRGERAEVRWCPRRFLSPIAGKPGQVLVRRERVLVVEPRGAAALRRLAAVGLVLQLPS